MLVLFTAGMYNASAQKKTATSDRAPLAPFYELKMKIVSHNKDNAAVSHATADYCKFSSNGNYEQSFNGTVQTGLWTYNAASKTITIRIGTASNTYTLSIPNSTKIGLNNTTEELVLVKP